MKRLCLILIFCLLLSACSSNIPAPVSLPDSPTTVTFTDDLGRSVTLANPQRVACLTASFADIWCAAGGAEQIIAATNATWTYFDLPLSEDVVNLGQSKHLDLEQLIACEPDLILASCGTDRNLELEDTLTRLGFPIAYFSVNSLEDYLRMLEVCTKITGQRECFTTNGIAVQARANAAIARSDGTRPTVLCLRVTGNSCKVKGSQGTVLGEMLAQLDCVNIADREGSLLQQLSMEVILQEDPEHIFLVLQNEDAQGTLESTLLADPAWNSLTAVKEGRCHIMDPNLFNLKPNARWGEAYEQLADLLYPAA